MQFQQLKLVDTIVSRCIPVMRNHWPGHAKGHILGAWLRKQVAVASKFYIDIFHNFLVPMRMPDYSGKGFTVLYEWFSNDHKI